MGSGECDAYEPVMAYRQSKVANIWTANYIDRADGRRDVHALFVHPGGTCRTDWRLSSWARLKGNPDVNNTMRTPEQGVVP